MPEGAIFITLENKYAWSLILYYERLFGYTHFPHYPKVEQCYLERCGWLFFESRNPQKYLHISEW